MKSLLLIFIIFHSTQDLHCQILSASAKKGFQRNLGQIKSELVGLNNQAEKSFFVKQDSVNFKLDTPKILNLIHRDSIYTHVEEEAYFMGGKEEMFAYIYKNLAKTHKKKGKKVLLKLIVENFGGISHPHVLNCGEDEKLANDILKIVRTMKVWTPAKIFGFDVNSYYLLEVIY